MRKAAILLLTLALFSDAQARTILTPKASGDYKARLEAQKSIARRMSASKAKTNDERQALQFLYAYMPTPDVLDYDEDFYLANIRAAFRAAEEMPWGATVPDREWRHFVLPVRVNNENLDMSRTEFYTELKDRVKGLSMKDAILEVNHWCHEKVAYQPSDARTSSPLATVCNALGRCGEESTFAVAALRSVGIPARQVYTPRWAHTDDNHAWVEAWADGNWYFLGACEPEAVLNLGWFNAPASRGMMMSTKVTGAYDGPEEVLSRDDIGTVINVTSNYAPTIDNPVVVTDAQGKPAASATVLYTLYNYAEYYPIARRTADSMGHTTLSTGIGDMIVWATDGRNFGLAKSLRGDTLHIKLDKDASFRGSIDFDIVPPGQSGNMPFVSDEAARINDFRKNQEDSIRKAYEATFHTPESATKFCDSVNWDSDAAQALFNSRGNHALIESFMMGTPDQLKPKAKALLQAIRVKDLHDISLDVLADHISTPFDTDELYNDYVLNPRVENEMLTPYKAYFAANIPEDLQNDAVDNPAVLAKWFADNVSIDNIYNPAGYRTSPASVWEYRIADSRSRDIAFVAACRSLGIAARIDPVSHAVQYAGDNGKWVDVNFGKKASDISTEGKGCVNLSSDADKQPKYYSQFTISRINNGVPQLFEFDEGCVAADINSKGEPLPLGQYILTTGKRLADGSVLSRVSFFEIESDDTTVVALDVRSDSSALEVIGSLDAELLYRPLDGEPQSILSTTGRGYYVLAIIAPGHEPSSHAINDIAAAASQLESDGRKILLLFPDEASATKFNASDYGELPSNAIIGSDIDGKIRNAIISGLELPDSTPLPLFVVADTFNRIIFNRNGYSINLGEQLHDVLSRVKE